MAPRRTGHRCRRAAPPQAGRRRGRWGCRVLIAVFWGFVAGAAFFFTLGAVEG